MDDQGDVFSKMGDEAFRARLTFVLAGLTYAQPGRHDIASYLQRVHGEQVIGWNDTPGQFITVLAIRNARPTPLAEVATMLAEDLRDALPLGIIVRLREATRTEHDLAETSDALAELKDRVGAYMETTFRAIDAAETQRRYQAMRFGVTRMGAEELAAEWRKRHAPR